MSKAGTRIALALLVGRSGLCEDIRRGFDFPQTQQNLESRTYGGQRYHTWRVFDGITRPASTGQPIFRTWEYAPDVFGPAAGPSDAPFGTGFQRPPELETASGGDGQAPLECDISPCQLVGFNPVAVSGLKERKFSDGTTVSPKCRDSIDALNQRFDANHKDLGQRDIPEFDAASIAIKTLWILVRDDENRVLNVWDPPPVNLIPPGKFIFGQWKNCVGVGPNTVEAGPAAGCGVTIPLERFYTVLMDTSVTDRVTSPAFKAHRAGTVKTYAVLIAMHLTTKEIPNWVWATFWWSNRPSDARFKKDMPPAMRARKPWNNYVMDVSYDMNRPQASAGIPKIAFNPYLEGQMAGGTMSNCMTCHIRAAYRIKDPLAIYRGVVGKGDLAPFADIDSTGGAISNRIVRTDFLWSVALNKLTCH